VIVRCASDEDQAAWLVGRVSELRQGEGSIAVIVPQGLDEAWRDGLIDELKSWDIKSRWAIGEDVRECEEQVILTDYESVVGLEFDNVLLPGCERVLDPSRRDAEAIQAAWAALTRARRHLSISHVGPVDVFNDAAFDGYRSSYMQDAGAEVM
jgi:hypothetical protein